ncbi:unnamed protein product [Phytomonas sp. Hart1]|nr:unnamed protein product [Phytomonas sp. Hart1]|eukprot:CCW67715.1 unnamed protein product [Phytomonas sp. isolate Hart1]
MTSTEAYTPTKEDLHNIILLLHNNGVEVSNPKDAYEQLKAYEGNPFFCILLATIFESDRCPLPDLQLSVPWSLYRQIAGITLKNNLSAAQHTLGEVVIKAAGRCALHTLCNSTDANTARAAAQIVVKVTVLASIDWWTTTGLGNLANILLGDLLPAGGIKTLSGLYALQYLMEDLPKQIGESSKMIIESVSHLAVMPTVSPELCKAAFRMCFNIYEQSSTLEWNVDTLSPLQNGLVLGSWEFINTCTFLIEQNAYGDDALFITVFRSCALMLDYFSYLPQRSPEDKARMELSWVMRTLHIISSELDNHNYDERRSAAIDLITGILEIYNASASEGEGAFLVNPFLQSNNIRLLVQSVVHFSRMSEDEVTTIMESDDYRTPDTAAKALCTSMSENMAGHKDLIQDDLLDEGEAAMSLRRSALRCINALCSFSTDGTFAVVIEHIKELWGRPTWKEREAGIVLLGTIASECAVQLKDSLDAIINQLVQFINNVNEHVCVSSIAIWTFSRLIEAIVTGAPQFLDVGITAIISRMQSTSRRIQFSSVSAVKTIYIELQNFSMSDKILSHMTELLLALNACLTVYSSTNLTVLIDIYILVMQDLSDRAGTAGDFSQLDQLGLLLNQESGSRGRLFQETYTSYYINAVPNVLLNKDVFLLHRGIIHFLSFRLNQVLVLDNLKLWCDLLHDIVARDIHDDVDFLYGTISLCCGYLSLIPTSLMQQWAIANSNVLTISIINLLHKKTSWLVQVASAYFLELLVRVLGSLVLPAESVEPLLTFITKLSVEEDSAPLRMQFLKLAAQLLITFKSSLDTRLVTSVLYSFNNQVLRCDVFGDTHNLYVQMAYTLCKLFDSFSSLAESFSVDTLCALMTQAPNNFEKSEATVHLCKAVRATPPAVAVGYIRGVVDFLIGYQNFLGEFHDAEVEAAGLLAYFESNCRDELRRCIALYPKVHLPSLFASYA